VISGSFQNVEGIKRFHHARLLSDGTHDTSYSCEFLVCTINNFILAGTTQADDKPIFGGLFTLEGFVNHNYLTRRTGISNRLSEGASDPFFKPNESLPITTTSALNNTVHALVLQHDGKILVGGEFTSVGSAGTRNRIARISLLDPAAHPLVVNSNALEWRFSGTSPTPISAFAELSNDGVNWSAPINGSRKNDSNTWLFGNVDIPSDANMYVRVRGRYRSSGSESELEVTRRIFGLDTVLTEDCNFYIIGKAVVCL
jgi:hypothetical protein